MIKSTYGIIQMVLLLSPVIFTATFGSDYVQRFALSAGWIGLVMILMDIRGLLLHPKQARMELDPKYKASVEAGTED